LSDTLRSSRLKLFERHRVIEIADFDIACDARDQDRVRRQDDFTERSAARGNFCCAACVIGPSP